MEEVNIYWHQPEQNSALWNCWRCLYAYSIGEQCDEIVYIGKAVNCSVRERGRRSAKPDFWKALEKERGAYEHAAFVGLLEHTYQQGRRISNQLIADIESLLIFELQPWGNIQSRVSRICRPGLKVICKGDWPLTRRNFLDQA